MRVDALRHAQSNHFPAELTAGMDQPSRNNFVFQDVLRPVNILQEQVQRNDSLRKSLLDPLPLVPRNNSGNQIEGEETFGPSAICVDSKGDSLQQEGGVGQLPALLEMPAAHR